MTELFSQNGIDLFVSFMHIYFSSTIVFFVLANSFYALILVLGFINARRQHVEKLIQVARRLAPLRSLKPISIIVPCYNEEAGIVASLESMLSIDYPEFEIIVCNDGSNDGTMSLLLKEFGLVSSITRPPQTLPSQPITTVYRSRTIDKLIVIDKKNGGKADALNAAINFSQYPLICCVDSDSIIDSEGLMSVALPFLEDETTIATGGTILLLNSDAHSIDTPLHLINTSVRPTWMGMIQAVEYLRAFLVGRLGWDLMKCDPIISGAFGLFKKSMVIKAGGYSTGTIGEDMELILRMQSYCLQEKTAHKVRLLPNPVCWTEPPSDLRTLANQRIRWAQGLAECLWRHRGMMFKPWAGRLGTIALPFLLVYELLSAPIEIFGYLILVIGLYLEVLDPWIVTAFMAVTILYGCILNLGSVVIDQMTFEKYRTNSDVRKLIFGAITEHFGFRQLHLFWRLQGLLRWMRGKQQWGKMKRAGVKSQKNQRNAA